MIVWTWLNEAEFALTKIVGPNASMVAVRKEVEHKAAEKIRLGHDREVNKPRGRREVVITLKDRRKVVLMLTRNPPGNVVIQALELL